MTTVYADYSGMYISPRGPDGKRYWHLHWGVPGMLTGDDVAVGRINGVVVGAFAPLEAYLAHEGRCVVTNMELYSSVDGEGVSAMAMIELSGQLNKSPYYIGPKQVFATEPDSFGWTCNVPVAVRGFIQMARIYLKNQIATTYISLHMEGWLDG